MDLGGANREADGFGLPAKFDAGDASAEAELVLVLAPRGQ
jgi:hypothetical protein